jgi:hypothetical protein
LFVLVVSARCQCHVTGASCIMRAISRMSQEQVSHSFRTLHTTRNTSLAVTVRGHRS